MAKSHHCKHESEISHHSVRSVREPEWKANPRAVSALLAAFGYPGDHPPALKSPHAAVLHVLS